MNNSENEIGDIYYCEHCGEIVDLAKDYILTEENIFCHICKEEKDL